jgi:cytochrome c551/c552
VTGDDVAAVIEGTIGTTVDGRPYKDPAFRQMLENYHTAALRAHKEHGGVGSLIPVPIPPNPASSDVPAAEARPTPHLSDAPVRPDLDKE